MKIKITALLLITVFIAIPLLGCDTNNDNTSDDKLSIISTVFPPYDFTRVIAGDNAEVSILLPAGGDSHSFEPSPKDIIEIKNCDLFIYIGGESDEYIKDILSSFDTPPETLVLSECVSMLNSEEKEGMEDGHDPGHDHTTEIKDEHIWTSLPNCIAMCSAIEEKLSYIDPENSEYYRSNLEQYTKELVALDNDFLSFSKTLDNKVLIFGDRFPFLYLAERYGFEYYAAFPGCSSESEPSAATISFLISKAEELDIKTIFYTESSSGNAARSIAEHTGARVAMLHSCHNITAKERKSGLTFIDLMKQNLETLKEAFGNGGN